MTDLLLISSMTEPMRERLEEHFTVHDAREMDDLDNWLAQNGGRVEAVFTDGHLGVAPDVMERLPNLKMITCYGVGYDNIDADACAKRNIVVTHTPDVLNDEVANTAVALLLATDRRIVAYDRYIREGRWEREGGPPLTRGLRGKVIGMVGFGRIGQTIADKLAAFGAEVVYHARSDKNLAQRFYANLEAMARDADILVVITPGGAETRHLVSKSVIEALGPEGTLVNVARGSVVDEGALVDALVEGRLGAAGLDVFDAEPHVPERLFALDNVVLTPHVGSATRETRAAMGGLAVDNAVSFFRDGTVHTPVPECRDVARTSARADA